MSIYIEAMTADERSYFKFLKKDFKAGKPCAICGKKLKSTKMTVDHVKRVTEGADPYDFDNWQVLCTPCHYEKSKQEARGEL